MKNATACAKKLTSLLKKLPAVEPAEAPAEERDPIDVLIESALMADATGDKARAAFTKLMAGVVDRNDLRVSMPHELVEIIGSRYPQGADRCQRLRAMLREIYLREHAVSLESVASLGKREVRKYIESLDGITPYVSARVLLLCYGVHAIPVDEQLRRRLIDAGAADESAEAAELSSWLSRQIKAADGLAAHLALQAWVETTPAKKSSARGKSGGRRASTAKKTTKKKTTRKKSAVK